MPDSLTILSSRRSYEYRADEIKLSLLCIRGVAEVIKSGFGFEYAEITTPTASFGPVVPTIPPGLVLALGVTPFPVGQGTAVRTIMIDSRRIVIDIAGPSVLIQPTFERLQELVKDIVTSEGASAIPEPQSHRDYSEIVTKSPELLTKLFNPSVTRLISEAVSSGDDSYQLMGSARFRLQSVEEEYPGSTDADSQTVNIDLRAGTKIGDHMIFSGAPLDSETHIQLIDRLQGATA